MLAVLQSTRGDVSRHRMLGEQRADLWPVAAIVREGDMAEPAGSQTVVAPTAKQFKAYRGEARLNQGGGRAAGTGAGLRGEERRHQVEVGEDRQNSDLTVPDPHPAC
jgi:hypothetical protein